MAESFGNFMASYGFYGIIIIIGVLICTQLTKWPIKKWAESYALENKLDVENGKKIVTRWLMIVPYVYSFIFTFIYVLGHDFCMGCRSSELVYSCSIYNRLCNNCGRYL